MERTTIKLVGMMVGTAQQEDYYGPAYQPMMSQQNMNTPSAPTPSTGPSTDVSHWGILLWAFAFIATSLIIPHIREWLE